MTDKERKQTKYLLLMVAAVTAVICGVIFLFFRTSHFTGYIRKLFRILTPFLYGIAIAYLLRPMSLAIERFLTALEKKICKKHHPGAMRMSGIIISLILFLAVVILLLLAVLPQLVTSVSGLIRQLPDTITQFENWISNLEHGETSHEVVSTVQTAVDTISRRLQEFLETDLLPTMESLVSNVTSSFMNLLDFLKNFGLGCIISAYILGSWERLITQAGMVVYGFFPKRAADWIRREVRTVDRMFSGFIHGKLLDSLIIGLICFAFMCITAMPYALLVSIIVGVTNIIPFFGPYLGAIPSLLLILTVSPVKSLVFLVFIILLQQFDGNILGPKILGDRLGISGIWILFSILFFGSLWGIVGMLIGVPVFAMLYDLFCRIVCRLLKIRGQQSRIEAYREKYSPEK